MIAPYLFLALLITYPQTRRVDVVDTIHTVKVSDPYRWLENDTATEVVNWVKEQQKCAENYLDNIPFRDSILKRVKEVNAYSSTSRPWHRAGHTFFYINDGVQNHSVLYMKKDTAITPEELIDPNKFSSDGTIKLAFAEESRDCKYLAFGKSLAGSDWHDIYVMDLASHKELTDTIKWVKNGGVSWYKDGFFYSRYPSSADGKQSLYANNSGEYICYHKIGNNQSEDEIVYRDTTENDTFIGAYYLDDAPFLVMYKGRVGSKGNKIYVRSFDNVDADWKLIFSSDEASFYPSTWHNGAVYGTTELGAPNGKVIKITDPLGKATTSTIIPEEPDPISSYAFGGGKIFITRMVDVHDRVEVYDTDGKHIGPVNLPGNGNAGGFHGFATDTILYYTYLSFTYPTTIFEYDVRTNKSRPWYKTRVPFDPTEFVEHQVFAQSKDGTKIPMFLLYKKGKMLDAKSPTMMFGYGGFGITYSPGFNPNYIPWLERGGVVVIPNLRGGGEYGEAWHDAGRKEKKQNVFDDAIACAQWLFDNKVTTKELLAINGRSNGGLLVGALMTQRPDMFRVAVPEVGVMDMLRYHLFTVGKFWTTDYGSVDKPSEFQALYAYSPYHRLRAGVAYPSTMVMTSDHDDRVVPAHSFKFAAELQNVYKGERPMILRVETKSGHGAVNREKALSNVADKYAFMWYEMGIDPYGR